MSLVGSWQLVSWESRLGDGRLIQPGGAHPYGDLIYTDTGRFAAQVADEHREPLGTSDPRGGTETAQACAFASYVAYCGTFEFDGAEVRHHVEMCTVPEWVGTTQQRIVDLTGGELTLRTPPMLAMGVTQISELRWRRRP